MTLTDTQLDRYARHILLREVGGAGQKKLLSARVLMVGVGGLGAPALLYLAAAGVGQITLVDDDVVSLSNLQRQVIHDTDAVGMPKVDSARRSLMRVNPDCQVVAIKARFGADNAAKLLAGHDLVLDGSDNFATRYALNAACVAARVPLISGAIGQWEGQLALFAPHLGGPCYACVFPERPADGMAPSCAEAGVMGALPGVVGAMMAAEAIKQITGAGQRLLGRLWLWDALYAEARVIDTPRDPQCPVCAAGCEGV